MPKPGYYYYQNRRAAQGVLFLLIIAGAVMISKLPTVRSGEDALMLVYEYRYFVSAFLLAFVAILWVLRLYIIRFGEPRPANYRTREEFLSALARYAERHDYMHGWIYHRSEELWPME